MAQEIERKFLVKDKVVLEDRRGYTIRQGYIAGDKKNVVRVSIKKAINSPDETEHCQLNVKGPTKGISRTEIETWIPYADAEQLLDLCGDRVIHKTRLYIMRDGLKWEIDIFHGDNAGLIVAEVELTSADQQITIPPWLGAEVSHDPKYYNRCLVDYPFSKWSVSELETHHQGEQ